MEDINGSKPIFSHDFGLGLQVIDSMPFIEGQDLNSIFGWKSDSGAWPVCFD